MAKKKPKKKPEKTSELAKKMQSSGKGDWSTPSNEGGVSE